MFARLWRHFITDGIGTPTPSLASGQATGLLSITLQSASSGSWARTNNKGRGMTKGTLCTGRGDKWETENNHVM